MSVAPGTKVPHRGMITISIMLATIMQALDTTIDTGHRRSLGALLGVSQAAANQD